MKIEEKSEKPGAVELWTVAPGSVVELDDYAGYWLVTDVCTEGSTAGLHSRLIVTVERDCFIALVDLADGEIGRYLGSTSVILVDAKVVVG